MCYKHVLQSHSLLGVLVAHQANHLIATSWVQIRLVICCMSPPLSLPQSRKCPKSIFIFYFFQITLFCLKTELAGLPYEPMPFETETAGKSYGMCIIGNLFVLFLFFNDLRHSTLATFILI